jgi:hypothetical protein
MEKRKKERKKERKKVRKKERKKERDINSMKKIYIRIQNGETYPVPGTPGLSNFPHRRSCRCRVCSYAEKLSSFFCK